MFKIISFLFAFCLLIAACENKEAKEERLAKTYCGSCHQFPEPGLLDKKRWQSVLPEMAMRMGVDAEAIFTIPEAELDFVLPTLPQKALVTKEEWQAISNYFLREAPDSLIVPPAAATRQLTQFRVEPVSLPGNAYPLLSLLHVDTATKTLYTSNRFSWVHRYDYQFVLKDSILLNSPTAAVRATHEGLYLLQMGIMDPNDQPAGSLLKVVGNKTITILDSLRRPVHFECADLNGDALADFVVCSFGNYAGQLVVYENLGGDQFKKHVLSHQPGARKVEVKDFDNDGLADILVLLTQGDEQISYFSNAGGFNFKPKTLLRFPPVYGSSYFETNDFNKDGHFDILYTNGDNADYSITLKPYHGVRIFLNNGNNQFQESWFYPMHGSSWATAKDFDHDGDLDVAALSFFPDFARTPEQSFIYFENNNNSFTAFTTPLATQGRWLLLETADMDSDKDVDVLLGALNFGNGVPTGIVERWKSKPVSLLLLRNQQTK